MAKKPEEKAIVHAQQGGELVDASMFEQYAGAGMEGTTAESFAIPFLNVLQKGSPQVDEASGVALEGAKAGMFYDNISGRMVDGKAGVLFVPCAYKRVFIHWGPKGSDGGFKGELSPETVAEMRAKGSVVESDGKLYIPAADGTVNDKKCDRISDTRNHYGLLLNEENGSFSQVLLSLSSTQIKKSKMMMSMLASVKFPGSKGLYTPPTFANVLKLTTVPESNDQGSWFGLRPEIIGKVERADILNAAKAFYDNVVTGKVEAKYGEPEAAEKEGF